MHKTTQVLLIAHTSLLAIIALLVGSTFNNTLEDEAEFAERHKNTDLSGHLRDTRDKLLNSVISDGSPGAFIGFLAAFVVYGNTLILSVKIHTHFR